MLPTVRPRSAPKSGGSIESALTEPDLDLPLSDRAPSVSIAQVLSHLVVEQSQHLGQVAMIRGVQRGLEFATSWNNPETPTPT